TSDCIFFDMLATRMLQFLSSTIERCSIVKATWRVGNHLGGRVQHAYLSRRTHEAARICLLGARLLLASLAPAFAQDPRAESSPGSTRATTPQAAIWAQASPSARDSTIRAGMSARSAARISPRPLTARPAIAPALLGYQFRAQSLFPETVRRHRGRGSEDQSARSAKFGARERRRSQALRPKLGSTSHRAGSCRSTPPMARRFSNIGVLSAIGLARASL